MIDINTVVYQLPIEVDVAQLYKEASIIFQTSLRSQLQKSESAGFSISVTGKPPDERLHRWYDHANGDMKITKDAVTGELLTKDFAKYTTGFPGPFREVNSYYENGTSDRDLTQWHPTMIDSEMFQLKERIASYFNIPSDLRCRISRIYGKFSIGKHADPHTPWRVHVNLKTGPKSHWKFYDVENNESVEWFQPTGSVWLVRTGNVQHEVVVPLGETRIQCFYHIWQRDLGPNYHQIA